jgi:hypothetical protein
MLGHASQARQERVVDRFDEHGLARSQRLAERMRLVAPARIEPGRLLQQRDLCRVGVGDGDAMQLAIVCEEVDDHDVRERRHRQLRDAPQRRLVVERSERRARVREEPELPARRLGGRARHRLRVEQHSPPHRLRALPRDRQQQVAIFGRHGVQLAEAQA